MATTTAQRALISAQNVTKRFPLPEGKGHFTVLEGINLDLRENEVLALLGRSGSGKSTLLRILAGLIQPSEGQVVSSGQPLSGPNADVAMVFQSFALLPWLTVQQNVELGLRAIGVEDEEAKTRSLATIDLVGLDGFESAYPRELSGGMKQRVGFARAFVLRPKALFMDEPFSALDVLTAENLRGEIGDLWEQRKFPATSVLIVTHNIEEAVLLADRVVVLGANPGKVRGLVPIDLPRPRERSSMEFREIVERLYTVMTNPEAEVEKVMAPMLQPRFPGIKPLPHARAGGISGLLEILVEHGGKEDVPILADRLQLPVDDLLMTVDAAVLLGFAHVEEGDIAVTPVGEQFATADILDAKEIFKRQVLENAPVVRMMRQSLMEAGEKGLPEDFFLDILDEHYPNEETERQFATAVDWGRYAEAFEYDAQHNRLSVGT